MNKKKTVKLFGRTFCKKRGYICQITERPRYYIQVYNNNVLNELVDKL